MCALCVNMRVVWYRVVMAVSTFCGRNTGTLFVVHSRSVLALEVPRLALRSRRWDRSADRHPERTLSASVPFLPSLSPGGGPWAWEEV